MHGHVATQVAGAGPLTHARTMSSSRIIRRRLHAPQKWLTLLLLSESFGPNRFIPSEDETRNSDTSHLLVLWKRFQLMFNLTMNEMFEDGAVNRRSTGCIDHYVY
jgi:hypothetical protein